MHATVRNREQMLAQLSPELRAGTFVFCSTRDETLIDRCRQIAIGSFHEAEGWSFILPEAEARALGCDCSLPMRQITLTVHSALDGVGLTAAVATELARHGIPCNMVAAFHHDHIFVPADKADAALAALQELQLRHSSSSNPS